MLANATVFRRWACEQMVPSEAEPHMIAHAVFATIGDAPTHCEDEFNRWYNE